MNQTLFLSQLRVIILVGIAFAAGKGWLSSADSGMITSILTPLGVIAGPWIWSIYSNINSKIVPQHAVVIDPVVTTANAGNATATVNTEAGTVTGKVVGVLALLILGALAFPGDARAQLKPLTGNIRTDLGIASKPAASAPAGSVDGAVQSFGEGIQKIEKALVDKGIADLTAAISDATNHNDNISLPCWQANLKLLQSLPSQWETPPSPIGIALGIQIQRDLLNAITGNDKDSLKVACAALWGDQIKIVANLGALIGVRIATGGLF